MKVGALKTELRSLGVTDLAHCVEKSDLERELNEARARPPRTSPASPPRQATASIAGGGVDPGNLKYGRVATVGNVRNPTSLVVFLHGLGDTCDGWASMLESDVAPHHPSVLFVLPTAATQRVTLNMGQSMPSWHDVRSLSFDAAEEDVTGMCRSAAHADRTVMEYADKFSIPQHRVVYAGFSQGGCIALFTGLTTPRGAPAGIVSLSGFLGGREFIVPKCVNASTPIFMAHGTQDPVVPLMVSQLSQAAVKQMCNATNLTYNTYAMAHMACDAELADLNKWLARVLA